MVFVGCVKRTNLLERFTLDRSGLSFDTPAQEGLEDGRILDDLRERVVAACDEGLDTRAEVAERFSVSESWIRRLLQRQRETGSIAPKPRGGGQPPAFDAERAERL